MELHNYKTDLENIAKDFKNTYKLGDILGKGQFASVYDIDIEIKGKMEKFAIKIFNDTYPDEYEGGYDKYKITLEDSTLIEEFNNILPDITVEYIGIKNIIINDVEEFGIVMEKLDGDLIQLLKEHILTEEEINELFNSILFLLKSMCENNIRHNDFTAMNIGYKKIDNKYCLVMIDPSFIEFDLNCHPISELYTLYISLFNYPELQDKIYNFCKISGYDIYNYKKVIYDDEDKLYNDINQYIKTDEKYLSKLMHVLKLIENLKHEKEKK